MRAAGMAPTSQQNSAGSSGSVFFLLTLWPLAWGEDGEPYLLSCAGDIIALGIASVKEKIKIFILPTRKPDFSLAFLAYLWYSIIRPFGKEAPAMKESVKIAAKNSKAYHDYFIEEKYETGIELAGTEVKSIRLGNVNLKDSFCLIKDGEISVLGMHKIGRASCRERV